LTELFISLLDNKCDECKYSLSQVQKKNDQTKTTSNLKQEILYQVRLLYLHKIGVAYCMTEKIKIAYNEAVEILDEFVTLDLAEVQRGETPAEDLYRISDFGIWLIQSNKFLEYDAIPESREAIRELYHEDVDRGWKPVR
jgi:hypothetical protein